ncbi:MAG: hypothetical protein A3J27_06960 [Candidatus Tectomicrobia bacterium RIFCSPLOWO2_12_FULL_69_37]|nr:MAG: hypothetical protein A3I72_08840 [Candidatus Tectomicrobia bacterium RIFCSPLOWO2_02_FULL_70_19]OGL63147.1 MAG: hypothetical protein A3J27_06960 [Candidatus Tectomicrobia bacterium RIFCSPLOWO2_12_FULL_69_37]
MSEGKERRGGARHRIPVVIDALSVSGFPLVPDDVSAGGFCLVTAREPGVGETFICSIQTGEELFGSCLAEVVWVRAKGGTPPLWSMGISVKSLGSDRARLATLLQELTACLGLAMLPY